MFASIDVRILCVMPLYKVSLMCYALKIHEEHRSMHSEEPKNSLINPRSLKALREARKLTQEKLAEKAGLSKRVVAACEDSSRDSRPREATAVKLAKALGVSVSALSEEQVDLQPHERPEPTTVRMTDIARENYQLIKEKYDVSRDEVVEFAPIMFAILAEMSLEWRRRTYAEWRDSLNHEDPVVREDIQNEWFAIGDNNLFFRPRHESRFEHVENDNRFGDFLKWVGKEWNLRDKVSWNYVEVDMDTLFASSFDDVQVIQITDSTTRIPTGMVNKKFAPFRDVTKEAVQVYRLSDLQKMPKETIAGSEATSTEESE